MAKNYNVTDVFLTDFLSSLTYDELKDCMAYSEAKIEDGTAIYEKKDAASKKQIDKGFLKMVEIYHLISDNLFDIGNKYGFPKARKFIRLYLAGYCADITIGEIAAVYVKRELEKRD